jgi:tRNA threonylcarbamoyladenosine biosynthesis protein TsaE
MIFSITFALDNIDKVARAILDTFPNERIFLFEGDLGSGKTTLIKSLCFQLGVESAVSSPTYGLINTYATKEGTPVYHFDLYRLRNIEEALDIGIEEYFAEKRYCFVEWPKKIVSLVPENYVYLQLKPDGDSRHISAKTIVV